MAESRRYKIIFPDGKTKIVESATNYLQAIRKAKINIKVLGGKIGRPPSW